MSAGAVRRLKIVFVTPEEPSVMPIFFERVIAAIPDEVAAVAVVSPIYKNSSWSKQAKRFIDAFGWREFIVEAACFGYYKVADVARRYLRVGHYHSVKSIARSHSLRLLTPASVNGAEFLDELREIDPDVVISVSCPQIFGKELLQLPRAGCINVHSALLPHYRGMLPTFWALARGERQTGVSVHYMTPGIDGGDIIVRKTIPITDHETLHSLMRKCKQVAAEAILETVSQVRAGHVTVAPNPPEEGSYFSFPAREDVRQFKALGRRLR